MEEMFKDEEFLALPVDKQKEVTDTYFEKTYADDEFKALPVGEQEAIKSNFFDVQIGNADAEVTATGDVEAKIGVSAKGVEPKITGFLGDVTPISEQDLIKVNDRPATLDLATQYGIGLLANTEDKTTRTVNLTRYLQSKGYTIEDMSDDENIIYLKDKDGIKYHFSQKGFKAGLMEVLGDAGENVGSAAGAVAGAYVAGQSGVGILGAGALISSGKLTGAAIGNMVDQWIASSFTGEELNPEQRAIEIGKAAAFSLGTDVVFAGGKLAKEGIKKTIDPFDSNKVWNEAGISPKAQVVARKANLSLEDTQAILKGVPKDQQEFILAEQTGGRSKGIIEGALAMDDVTKQKYLENFLNERKLGIEKVAGKQEFPAIQTQAKKEYDDMVKMVGKIADTKQGFDLSWYSDRLGAMEGIARTDASKTVIQAVRNQLTAKPMSNISDMIDLRQLINREMEKSKGTAVYAQWKDMKTNLDTFMGKNVPSNVMGVIDNTIKNYSSMKNQEELLQIIEKATSYEGKGSKYGEVGAVDWTKVYNGIKAEGLDKASNGEAIKQSLKISENFMKKFGNMDVSFFNKATGKAESDTVDVLTSSPLNWFNRQLTKAGIKGGLDYYNQLVRVQMSISDIIKKSNSQAEFFNNIVKSKTLPQEIKDTAQSVLDTAGVKTDAIADNVSRSVKYQDDAIKFDKLTNLAQVALEKKQFQIETLYGSLEKLQTKMALGKEPTEAQMAALDNLKTKIKIAEKEEAIAEQRYTQAKQNLDYSRSKVEELSPFNQRPEAMPKQEVKPSGVDKNTIRVEDSKGIEFIKVKDTPKPDKPKNEDILGGRNNKANEPLTDEEKEAMAGYQDFKKKQEKKDMGLKPNEQSMTVGHMRINKTEFQLVKERNRRMELNRRNPANKLNITEAMQMAHKKFESVADDLKDVDFKNGGHVKVSNPAF